MGTRNKLKQKRINLLEVSSVERKRLIGEVKERIRERTLEAKLWHSLLELENLTVNGDKVFEEPQQLNRFYTRNKL